MANPVPPASRAEPRVAIITFTTLALALVIVGCSSNDGSGRGSPASPAAPVTNIGARPPGTGPFIYPLAVGDRWRYEAHSTIQMVDASGTHPISAWDTSQQDEITGTMTVDALDYFFLHTAYVDNGFPGSSQVLFRQDGAGLFDRLVPTEAAALGGARPARALAPRPEELLRALAGRPDAERLAERAATLAHRTLELVARSRRALRPADGAAPGELTLLRYPLTPARSWDVGSTPVETRQVIGRMRLITPAGALVVWRVQSVPSYFGAGDQLEFWYADVGYAGYRVHTEDVLDTGDPAHPAGTLVMESEGMLAEVHLN